MLPCVSFPGALWCLVSMSRGTASPTVIPGVGVTGSGSELAPAGRADAGGDTAATSQAGPRPPHRGHAQCSGQASALRLHDGSQATCSPCGRCLRLEVLALPQAGLCQPHRLFSDPFPVPALGPRSRFPNPEAWDCFTQLNTFWCPALRDSMSTSISRFLALSTWKAQHTLSRMLAVGRTPWFLSTQPSGNEFSRERDGRPPCLGAPGRSGFQFGEESVTRSTGNLGISVPPGAQPWPGPSRGPWKSSQGACCFPPQDSSSVIQFMTRAKVQADPALRVVEVANGNPEDMSVSRLAGTARPRGRRPLGVAAGPGG